MQKLGCTLKATQLGYKGEENAITFMIVEENEWVRYKSCFFDCFVWIFLGRLFRLRFYCRIWLRFNMFFVMVGCLQRNSFNGKILILIQGQMRSKIESEEKKFVEKSVDFLWFQQTLPHNYTAENPSKKYLNLKYLLLLTNFNVELYFMLFLFFLLSLNKFLLFKSQD